MATTRTVVARTDRGKMLPRRCCHQKSKRENVTGWACKVVVLSLIPEETSEINFDWAWLLVCTTPMYVTEKR
jgi:hypothetical protein